MRKSPSSVRSRTINTRRSLTETTATSPATANRSVTAAEQRRPLYVPNTKNNRNSTRPYLQNQQGSSNHDHEPFVNLYSRYRGTPRYRPLTARDVNGIDLESFTKPPSHRVAFYPSLKRAPIVCRVDPMCIPARVELSKSNITDDLYASPMATSRTAISIPLLYLELDLWNTSHRTLPPPYGPWGA